MRTTMVIDDEIAHADGRHGFAYTVASLRAIGCSPMSGQWQRDVVR